MLRLIGFLVMAVIGLGGFLTLDYNMARQFATEADEEIPTFQDYLGGLSGRLASISASSASPGQPRDLIDMMPKPPEGWTVRPAVAEDVAGFQPKSNRDGDPEARKLITAIGSPKAAYKAEAIVLTYEKGNQKVVVKAARYPDSIFTGQARMQERSELQSRTAMFRGLSFMTVRGLDVTEDVLPDKMRARLFTANVGAQIHIWMLAPKQLKDADLLPFFQTLNVKAMNGSVVDRQDGLGDVPVIVLASALGAEARDAYLADRAAREAAEVARRKESRKIAEATAEGPAQAQGADCAKGTGGIKRCTVGN